MIIQIGISIVAICLAIQDFKYRSVNLLLMLCYGLVCLVAFCFSSLLWMEAIFNLGFLTLLFLTSLLLIRWRYKIDFKNAIGAGDVMFLYFSGFLFLFDQFVIWVIVALIFSLGLHLVVTTVLKVREQKIPLLGYMTPVLILSIFFEWFEKF